MNRRRASGQAMVLVAILSGVLVGFVGLVIDVGGVASGHEQAQAAADAAALAGAYEIQQGATEAAATAYAQAQLTQDGLPAGNLTISYLDSGGNPTLTASSVASVQAVVAFSYSTRFLPILGVGGVGVSATAQASVNSAAPPCGLCVMNGSGQTVTLASSSHVTVSSAGIVVNSTGNPNVSAGAGSGVTATAIRLAANHVTGSGTYSPAVTTGSAAADPLPSLAVPAFPGFGVPAFSTPTTGSSTISPGAYNGITVNGTYALTLNPGTYIFAGPLVVNGGTVTGSGVTVYFTCGTGGFNPPAACAPAGQAGGNLTVNGGTTTLSAPASGTYQGVVMFGDRNNTATNTLSGGSGSFVSTGTIYTELMPWVLGRNGDAYTLNSELIGASVAVTGTGASLTLAYNTAQNAPNQVGAVAAGTVSLKL